MRATPSYSPTPMPATLVGYSDETLRKAKYDFADLQGIIFGIRTPEEAKLKIARIIEDKCHRHGRSDFKFYQAFYSRQKGTIDHGEMRLLRFQM